MPNSSVLRYSNINLNGVHTHNIKTFDFISLRLYNTKYFSEYFSQFMEEFSNSCRKLFAVVLETLFFQLSTVAQSCLTLCDPMNRSTPGLPVHHQLPESTQTRVHRVGDAIQLSHPLSSPSPPALNLVVLETLFFSYLQSYLIKLHCILERQA